MLNLKRAWDEMSDSDNEQPMMGRRSLPVAQLPADFKGEPTDGMQYLFMVRRDSFRLPSVVRVENPYASKGSVASSNTTAVTRRRGCITLPAEGWRARFLQRFKNFRNNIQQATIGVSLPPGNALGANKLMPNMKERDHWWAFISGLPENDWNPPKKTKALRHQQQRSRRHLPVSNEPRRSSVCCDDASQYEVSCNEAVDATEGAHVFREDGQLVGHEYHNDVCVEEQSAIHTTIAEDRHVIFEETVRKQGLSAHRFQRGRPRQPSTTLLKSMDSRYSTHLLMYFAHWLSQHLAQLESGDPLPKFRDSMQISRAHACWMFALLANVDEHISSDEISNLRSLARACLAFVKELNKNTLNPTILGTDEASVTWVGDLVDAPLDEKACWIIVTAIADFWGQKDLWMDAEYILNKG